MTRQQVEAQIKRINEADLKPEDECSSFLSPSQIIKRAGGLEAFLGFDPLQCCDIPEDPASE
jgi:hypothetical protein